MKTWKAILISIVVSVAMYVMVAFATQEKSVPYANIIEYQVMPNDTYWGIAGKYIKSTNLRIMEFAYEIEKASSIPAGKLHPGDIIRIPVRERGN